MTLVPRALLPLLAPLVLASAAHAATRAVDAPAAARLTHQGTAAGATGAGTAVTALGDVNGDGRPDAAIGAPFLDLPGRPDAGTVYVVFGSAAKGAATLDEVGSTVAGFKIVGGKNYRAGFAVAAAGDVNGDGRPDILLSAPRQGVAGYKTPGSAYVVFGKADSTTIDLTTLTPAQGFRIVGLSPAQSADTVAGVGDVDGDGYADLLVNEGYFRKRGLDYRGGAALIYGRRLSTRLDLQHLGTRGVRITGGTVNGGPSVAAAGDVNGDGRPDLLLGAPSVRLAGKRYPTNSAFVVFGRRYRSTLDLRRLGSRGLRIGGLVGQRIYRPAVAGIGDLNRDGRADVAVIRDPGGTIGRRPQAAVVFGSRSTRTVDLGHLGSRGFRILGQSATGRFSLLYTVAGVGDLNVDGIPDLALGSATRPRDGAYDYSAFVIFGRRAASALSLENLGDAGVRLTGPPASPQCGAQGVGAALAGAGDPDGDGHNEILLGAPALGACTGQALFVAP
jgi:hypothetical protein